jgi:pectate lyase
MKIANSTVNASTMARVFRRLGLGFQGTLLLLILLAAVSPASAAIEFDNATASKAKHNTSEISWKHKIGGGADRALVVAVSFNDFSNNDNGIAAVKLGSVVLRPVTDSLARSSGWLVQTTTQLFYLNGGEMPAPGTYEVAITFTRKVDEAAGGAVSLFGVEPVAPAAAATNADFLGLGQISTNINAPAYSWVVDVVASGSGADLAAGTGQTERFTEAKKEIGIAGSAQATAFGGATTLFWQQADSTRLVTSAVAFAAKPVFKLSQATNGAGTIQTSPGGEMFHEGEPAMLTAVPAIGWEFAGWGGDVTGTANPVALTMDGNKSVTANFIQVPPSISTQPASQTVNAGSNVNFNVAAGGTPPLSYQWHKDGVSVPGANADTLSLQAVQADAAGSYTVTVTNGAGSITSSPAVLSVITPPAITTQPTSQTVNAGQTATFSVAASGAAPFNYQWRKNGSDIAGANDASLSVVNAQDGDAGTYAVVVSNAAGAATSGGAVLTVITPPSITTQPSAQTAPVGSSVSFSVAASGTSPFTYLWKKDGANIAGANSETLSLSNVQNGDAGAYTVVVSNAAGSATSEGAALTVITPPSINIQPEPQTVNAGATANFFVAAGGTAPLSYQWKKDGADIAGATSASLSVAGVQDGDAGTYTVVVSNAAGSATSVGVALTVTHIVPPTITTQPASQTANVGDGVSFTVVAGGAAPFNYQWQKNGSAITGANGASLTLANVQLSDAGDYSVEVNNDAGLATSEPATLTVVVPPSVFLRERFADATRATQNLPASADWFTSSGSSNFTATAGQATQLVSSSRTLLTYFTNSSATPVTVATGQTLTLDFTVQFSGFDTGASVGATTFSVGLLRSVANPAAVSGTGFNASGAPNTNARVSGDFGSNNPSSNVFTNYGGYAAMTYAGQSGTTTPVKLYARTGANASLLNSASPYAQFTTGATVTPSSAMLANTDYRGTLTLENTGSGVRVSYTLKDAATGGVVTTYSAVQSAGSFTQFDTAAFYLSKASASANYNLVIKSADVSLAGSSDPGDAPTITTQPVSQTVPAGANVSFSVAAEGTAPLAYQWQKNGLAIGGATAATLNLTNVQGADAGSYRVTVSNAAGLATSTAAALNVETQPVAPAITSQPASQIVVTGGSAGFGVIASGSAPLSYQWHKDGSPLAGANASTLSLSNVQAGDAGGYSVVVSNVAGTATSNTATLNVTDQLPGQIYNLQGFAQAATGGGLLPDSDPNYRKVYTADDLVAALGNRNTKVIEIMNDLNLGYNEVPASARTGALRSSSLPLTHPVLVASGVSIIDIQDKNGLTIFSANGATIRHANFNVKRASNLLIRNLKFDELWEWDESSKGKYDKQGWDFITVDMTSDNVWIDHCTFTKAYDGVVDVKGGTKNVTISWSSFLADDGGAGSFVRRQIEALEANRSAYVMYNFLRSNGFSVEDIIAVSRSQKKGHLIGANEFDTENADHRVTLHHNHYLNMQDRLPRLRGGNAHAYNLYVNNAEALAAKDLRNARVAAMSSTNAARLTGSSATYSFDVTLNGAISTEGGAVLLEKSQLVDVLSPLRNNQVSASQPQYTGKILALDTLYQRRGVVFRGDSTTPGSPLAPVPAPEVAFSWNGFAALPYSYTTHDPSQLPSLLTGTEGAGAGALFWPKENWLKTAY